ncbi:DNA-binding anti-repressor SinI [Metabacillus sp. Hm71]
MDDEWIALVEEAIELGLTKEEFEQWIKEQGELKNEEISKR